MQTRTAHPYRDLDVIDSRGPRTNQAVIGALALVAFVFDAPWLVALLGFQLVIGLTFGRRFCLPCLLYFEVIQPRFGEGRLEDSRPPRFANFVGATFLLSATAAFLLGAPTLGWILTLIVSALALLAATSGLCVGCQAYLWLVRLRALRSRTAGGELEGPGAVVFTSPLCLACREWVEALEARGVPFRSLDVTERPELARRYRVWVTPLVLALAPGGRVLAAYDGDPSESAVARVAGLARQGAAT